MERPSPGQKDPELSQSQLPRSLPPLRTWRIRPINLGSLEARKLSAKLEHIANTLLEQQREGKGHRVTGLEKPRLRRMKHEHHLQIHKQRAILEKVTGI